METQARGEEGRGEGGVGGEGEGGEEGGGRGRRGRGKGERREGEGGEEGGGRGRGGRGKGEREGEGKGRERREGRGEGGEEGRGEEGERGEGDDTIRPVLYREAVLFWRSKMHYSLTPLVQTLKIWAPPHNEEASSLNLHKIIMDSTVGVANYTAKSGLRAPPNPKASG